jgi:hypothetical protein
LRFANRVMASERRPAFSLRLFPSESVHRIHQTPLPFSRSKIPRIVVIAYTHQTNVYDKSVLAPQESWRNGWRDSLTCHQELEHFLAGFDHPRSLCNCLNDRFLKGN